MKKCGSAEKLKVLVSGGSGFLGINMVRKLLEKGVTDIVVLDSADFDYPEKERIAFIKGDIRDKFKVGEAMRGVKQVVHTAAALPLYSKKDIMTTDVDGTRNLLEAAEKNNVERFIHISSTAVYGIPDHHPLLENDKLIGVGPYGEAKILAEEVCLEFRKKGMIVPILRPKSFIGPERLGVFVLLYDWAKDGKNFPMIGSGNNRYQLLDVEDLAESIWLCMTRNADIVNDTFNIGAKNFTTMKEDYQAVLDYAGFGKKIIGFPAKPAIWALRILEFLRLSPLYKWVYETACEDSFVSIEKAEKVLEYKPVFSNKDALIRNYKWYLDNLKKFESVSGISHRVPWKQGILKIIKKFF
ncbi:MAG TPA: NAD-dependent epimerase/dehydratase family protein [Candidatus Wallbacteria bacterium]|nr:MAG: 3 beta-hydroxysteroid dehydrogenase/Delta 5-->4-isomerase [bacterium ADurb.Bin243]HOD40750.1 NAD-dependent epimerase/dehydratase family protein [Candidatus Wallbacteria bacterium]HPG57120.1 NAD-dependent epimerase/dehydratase family protein [Candidatus Wallbacteria bacterium]